MHPPPFWSLPMPRALPPAHPEEPAGGMVLPSWVQILQRSRRPEDLYYNVRTMLDSLPEEARYEVVAYFLQQVATQYSADTGVPIVPRYFDRGEAQADADPPNSTPIIVILHELATLTNERPSSGGQPSLQSALSHSRHHYDFNSDRNRFWGLARNVPPGLGRFWLALGAWAGVAGTEAKLAGILVSAVTALLEREGYVPEELGLTVLPGRRQMEWAVRWDELFRTHMQVIAGGQAAALEMGFPITWHNIPRLLETLVPDEDARAQRSGKRALWIAAQTAVQLTLQNPRPDLPQAYLDLAYQGATQYLEPLIEGQPLGRGLRDLGRTILAANVGLGPVTPLQHGPNAGAALVESIVEMPAKRNTVDAATRLVRDACRAAAGGFEPFVVAWWAAVRNRLPLRSGRERLMG